MPTPKECADRLAAVLHVLYLIFNEGYTSSFGSLQRTEVSSEAIRLARALRNLLRTNQRSPGCWHSMPLTDAVDPVHGPDGELIPLDKQDRTLWNESAIAEGVALVSAALSKGMVGPYQVHAAIAAVHDGSAPKTRTGLDPGAVWSVEADVGQSDGCPQSRHRGGHGARAARGPRFAEDARRRRSTRRPLPHRRGSGAPAGESEIGKRPSCITARQPIGRRTLQSAITCSRRQRGCLRTGFNRKFVFAVRRAGVTTVRESTAKVRQSGTTVRGPVRRFVRRAAMAQTMQSYSQSEPS